MLCDQKELPTKTKCMFCTKNMKSKIINSH